MATYKVTVELVFEGIEADYPGKACQLAELWCHPLPPGCDAFRSYAERIPDEKAKQEAQGVQGVRPASPQVGQDS